MNVFFRFIITLIVRVHVRVRVRVQFVLVGLGRAGFKTKNDEMHI